MSTTESYIKLGVLVTSDFSWSEHILRVTERANTMLFLLSKVFAQASPSVIEKLFKAFVRSLMDSANNSGLLSFKGILYLSNWSSETQPEFRLVETSFHIMVGLLQ